MKHIIMAAERDGVEANEALMQRHTALLMSPAVCATQALPPVPWYRQANSPRQHWQVPGVADQWCYKTYVYGQGACHPAEQAQPRSHVTLRLSVNLLEGDTGCHEWEAGFHLAEFVLNNPSLVLGAPPALCTCIG